MFKKIVTVRFQGIDKLHEFTEEQWRELIKKVVIEQVNLILYLRDVKNKFNLSDVEYKALLESILSPLHYHAVEEVYREIKRKIDEVSSQEG